ncbi:MAG TPA: hemerythrin domain-containing protein [Azoarcus taiwanensis]|uniref:Hemerythrin domain-containing protein n=1 Tax=Azoarcus taiwanensis TaxID=666964 RepID=A0A972FC52_9RHOO|nr:hemerythrin domain-containing protein [Azoarcus taiwanensis]NMG01920.1 hemerythrin domain-containing protein [Azoarcus taiwanensis]HRQ58032.1 hemerythrin domain-containing protein [Azoarcus taiwanensis]
MTKSLIPVSPGFDEPLEMLTACHERLHAQLETLRRLSRWLPEHGVDEPARRAAASVIRYFDHAAVNHHMDEEQDLFPLLLRKVSADRRYALVALIDWIKEDHQRMFAAWADMKTRLEALVAGEAFELSNDVVDAFCERYVMHTDREESELLPHAQALLDEEDLAALGQTMTARRRQPAA